MIAEQYFVTTSKGNEVTFKYNFNGVLIGFECHTELTKQQINFFGQYIPYKPEDIKELCKLVKGKAKLIPTDLSFERFWNTYKNTKGKLAYTRNIWKSLDDVTKIKALLAIKPYQNQCRMDGTMIAYPSTYLNQCYYENHI